MNIEGAPARALDRHQWAGLPVFEAFKLLGVSVSGIGELLAVPPSSMRVYASKSEPISPKLLVILVELAKALADQCERLARANPSVTVLPVLIQAARQLIEIQESESGFDDLTTWLESAAMVNRLLEKQYRSGASCDENDD